MLNVEWFLLDIKPLEDTSKQFTVHLYCVMSVTKWAYLFDYSVFLMLIISSRGHVNSKI